MVSVRGGWPSLALSSDPSSRIFTRSSGEKPRAGASTAAVLWAALAVAGTCAPAVAPAAAGRGVGTKLVRACLAEAVELGLRQVYTLTLVPEFFERLGFARAERDSLHIKVWYECYKCPKFANCDEIAMIRPVGPDRP